MNHSKFTNLSATNFITDLLTWGIFQLMVIVIMKDKSIFFLKYWKFIKKITKILAFLIIFCHWFWVFLKKMRAFLHLELAWKGPSETGTPFDWWGHEWWRQPRDTKRHYWIQNFCFVFSWFLLFFLEPINNVMTVCPFFLLVGNHGKSGPPSELTNLPWWISESLFSLYH